MRASEYSPNPKNELIKAFIDKFGGYFMASIHDFVEYVDKEENSYDVPDTRTEFFDMISQSLKMNKNLFLDLPDMNIPEGALE